jgi:hypothetical protein
MMEYLVRAERWSVVTVFVQIGQLSGVSSYGREEQE